MSRSTRHKGCCEIDWCRSHDRPEKDGRGRETTTNFNTGCAVSGDEDKKEALYYGLYYV